ncbi:MAG: hypothetical protein EB127_21700 [Alphaproteobacteria bacterium]|nr:hypothetical protein [Alphaproteobacteria bacterium]
MNITSLKIISLKGICTYPSDRCVLGMFTYPNTSVVTFCGQSGFPSTDGVCLAGAILYYPTSVALTVSQDVGFPAPPFLSSQHLTLTFTHTHVCLHTKALIADNPVSGLSASKDFLKKDTRNGEG